MSGRLYTAHLRPGRDPVGTVLIADRWRWGAALFPLLWALWNRHWIAAALLLGASAGIGAIGAFGGPASAVAAEIGLRLAVGWEGGALARLDRRLRGWRELGAVFGDGVEAAERRWFARPAPVEPVAETPDAGVPWGRSGAVVA